MSTPGKNGERADRARRHSAFYESHPYPAPINSLEPRLDRYRDPHRRQRKICCYGLWRSRAQIGRSLSLAAERRRPRVMRSWSPTRVTAIDISETSLRHTRELQEKHDIRKLQLHHLPIERIGELGETFDQIVCTGVLHHLSDPDAGLRSLRDVLAREARCTSWSTRLTDAPALP